MKSKTNQNTQSRYALILANGEPPSKRLIQTLRKNASVFVCADGGANAAARLKLRPDVIIGDLDSVHATTLKRFPHAKRIRIDDQYTTDLEKAIMYLVDEGHFTIVVLGAEGRRLDHTVGNIGALAKFSDRASISFRSDDGTLSAVGTSTEFEAQPGSTISLIPLTRCEGITTHGLEYPLDNESLELGARDGTSNRVVSNPVRITVTRGRLLLYHRSNASPLA